MNTLVIVLAPSVEAARAALKIPADANYDEGHVLAADFIALNNGTLADRSEHFSALLEAARPNPLNDVAFKVSIYGEPLAGNVLNLGLVEPLHFLLGHDTTVQLHVIQDNDVNTFDRVNGQWRAQIRYMEDMGLREVNEHRFEDVVDGTIYVTSEPNELTKGNYAYTITQAAFNFNPDIDILRKAQPRTEFIPIIFKNGVSPEGFGNGITPQALLAVIADHLDTLQAGSCPSELYEEASEHVRLAIEALRAHAIIDNDRALAAAEAIAADTDVDANAGEIYAEAVAAETLAVDDSDLVEFDGELNETNPPLVRAISINELDEHDDIGEDDVLAFGTTEIAADDVTETE